MSRHFQITFTSLSLLILSVSDFVTATSPIASICSVSWPPSTAYNIFSGLVDKTYYLKDVRPFNSSETADPITGAIPTNVEINFFISHIENIDESNGAFRVQLIFRQKWVDQRLSYQFSPQYTNACNENRPSTLRVPDSMIDSIWTPDLYIIQELDSKRNGIFHPDRLMKVNPDGKVLLSERITLTLACPQLARLDLTKKECDMNVESYGFLEDEMKFEWKEEDPIFVLTDTFVPKRSYKLDKVTPLRCDTKTQSGTYSCIKAKFSFSKGNKN